MKAVQAFSKDSLVNQWVEAIYKGYCVSHNPLGLIDDFIIHLEKQLPNCLPLLEENYDILAAIYRLRHGDNQLEFQWDGRTHMDKYDEEWKAAFAKWSIELAMTQEFQRPILKFSLHHSEANTDFLKASIRRAILSKFGVKLRAQKLYQLSA